MVLSDRVYDGFSGSVMDILCQEATLGMKIMDPLVSHLNNLYSRHRV